MTDRLKRLSTALAYQKALEAIASLPTPENEYIMQGHEEAYRAIEDLVEKEKNGQ